MTGTTTGRVRVERREGAAVVWLDNPARRNALSRTMIGDLLVALRELDADPAVGVIVVRGVEGTFCSGLDLTSLGGASGGDPASGPGDEHTMIDLANHLEQAFAELQTLSVAVVEGYAIGAGCQIALGCTMRLAVPGGAFAIPVGRLGLVYPPTSVARLVGLVGESRAVLMLATGRRIEARTARDWGLATDLVGERDDQSVDAGVDALLAEVAAGSRLSLTGSLQMVRAIAGDPRGGTETPEVLYRHWSELSGATGEHAEALAARAEKRAPQFPWRPGTLA